MKLKKMFSLKQIFLTLILIFLSLTMLVPLLNILAVSLSSPEASVLMSGIRVIPKDFDLINYRIVFNHPVLMRSVFNSIYITVIG